MSKFKTTATATFVALALQILSVSGGFAAEKLPTGPCEYSTLDASAAAEKCKLVAVGGSADAMFQLGIMLLKYSADAKTADELAKWKSIGTHSDAMRWIEDAANKGSDQAIAYLCGLGSEPNASSSQRAESKIWCEQLQ